MTGEWIDVTVPIKSGMVHWPGDPEIRVERVLSIERGDPANVSHVDMGTHTGTHMDPPFHYVRGGLPLDQMPLDAGIGPARVVEIHDSHSIKPAELEQHNIREGERILFKTHNSTRGWQTDEFIEDFVFISRQGAQFLADRGVRLVGIDYLSVGGFKEDGDETHHALLENGVWILEGLNLSSIQPGAYELICLPMKILESDGAPARAILRPAPSGGA
jgi:arylformamidase